MGGRTPGGASDSYNWAMAGSEGLEMPIFELPAVILPGELMPLHIFEERYKRMIGHCLESEEPFGIVFRDDDGGARRIGCTARVAQVVERFDDGRLDVIVAGELPFRVLDRFEAPDYPSGEVEPIHSEAGEDEADEQVAEVARDAFTALVERVSGEPPDGDALAADDAYAIAARVELPVETKQRLLELRSEPERMRVLGEALRALVDAVDRSEEIAERARMNGKVVVG
jgi:Lon protease-like protein